MKLTFVPLLRVQRRPGRIYRAEYLQTHAAPVTLGEMLDQEGKADWQNWSSGTPDHVGAMHIARKK